jgi:iron complex outermembrane recepter protein
MKIFSLILLTIAANSYAQIQLKGTVTDDSTHEKLKSVIIYIRELNRTAITDENGEFMINDVPSGLFEIRFSLLGYKTINTTIEVNKTFLPLTVEMTSAEISTEEILVTETKVETPYSAEKITAKDLQRQAAMNVSQAVTKIPGVWELSSTSGVSKPVIRGLYGDRIGIMINGIRFDNQQWQDEHGLVMYSDGIDNIEVIKGPRSLLYGPEAIGGVVSISNERPAPIGEEEADLNMKFFSSTLGILSDIGLKGAKKNYNWLLRFGGETHADYLDGNGDRIPATRFAGFILKGNAGYNKGIWVGSLNYSYTRYTYGMLEEREFQREISTFETRFDRSFSGPNHKLGIHHAVLQNAFFTGKSKMKINAGYTYNRRQEVEGADERFLPDSLQFGNLDMRLKTFSLDASWNYTVNKNLDVTLGSQGFTQTNRNDGTRRLVPDANVTSLSGTGILKYQKKRLGFEGGVRFDLFKLKTTEFGVKDSTNYFPSLDLTFSSINGSAGATYRINKNLLVKGNFSTGFRAPNLAELTSNGLHEGTFQYELGNPNFKSEQSFETDLGLVYESKYLSLDASAYNNRINNYIYLGTTSDTIRGYPVYKFNQSDATLRGMEADVIFKPNTWLSLRGTYSVVLAEREDGVNLPLIPADRITTALHAEFKGWMFFYSPYAELSTAATFRKTRLGENETSLPGYMLLNASVGFDLRFEKQLLNVVITCNNLLNKVYIDFMSRIKNFTAEYQGKIFQANNMGRNIVMTVRVPFKLSYN